MVSGVASEKNGNQRQNATVCLIACSHFVNILICRMLCFMKKFVERRTPYKFISHTNKLRCRSLSERDCPRITLLKSLPNEQRFYSFSR